MDLIRLKWKKRQFTKNSNDENSPYFCSHCPNRSKATLKQIQSPPSPCRLRASCRCLRCHTNAIAVTVAATILPLLSTLCHTLLVEWAATETPPPCRTSQGLLLRVSFAVFASLPPHQKQPAMFQNLSLLCRTLLHLEKSLATLGGWARVFTCCLRLSPAIKRVEIQSNGWGKCCQNFVFAESMIAF